MESKLKQEIGKVNDFESLEQEVFLNLVRTADMLTREMDAIFKPLAISGTQYNVLRILRGSGEAALACREIGDRMITQDPDMTRLLDRLEARQLIARSRDTVDRRVVKTRITEQGLELLSRLDEPLRQMHKQLLAHMDERQLKTLNKLLETARSRPGETNEG